MPTTQSSAITRIHHNEREMTIVFRESGVYGYADVPREVYEAFVAAASKGRFFNEAIRGRYACRCIRRFTPAWNRLRAASQPLARRSATAGAK